MDRLAYIVSDLHLGPGRDAASGEWNSLEDFQVDELFCAFLDRIEAADAPVELIIAGDFIEYPQILPEYGLISPAHHLGCTGEESLERTRVLLGLRPDLSSGHPAVFARLRRFMEEGHSITIIPGNHDIDLFWPKVWALLFDTIYPPGAAGELRRKTFSHVIGSGPRGRVYIEHGHERSPDNRFGDRMEQPFVYDATGVRRLKRCWGTLFVDLVYNQLERERWFIDNVKPIARVIKMGLRNDVAFTAGALALIVKFFLTSSVPLSEMISGTLSAEEPAVWPKGLRNADAVVASLDDDELRAYLEQRMADPAFRTAFEAEVREFDEIEWQAMQAGAAHQPVLDPVDAASKGLVLGEALGREDAYRTAAREVMEADHAIETVVMGHTHHAIDGLVKPLYLSGQRTGYYFNSGTWTPHLRDRPDYTYTWAEIADSGNYTSSLTYLRCVPDVEGAYRVELRSWGMEYRG